VLEVRRDVEQLLLQIAEDGGIELCVRLELIREAADVDRDLAQAGQRVLRRHAPILGVRLMGRADRPAAPTNAGQGAAHSACRARNPRRALSAAVMLKAAIAASWTAMSTSVTPIPPGPSELAASPGASTRIATR